MKSGFYNTYSRTVEQHRERGIETNMSSSPLLIPAILLTTLLSLSQTSPATPELNQSHSSCNSICQEIQEMKLKITHLDAESILEENIQSFDLKIRYLNEKDKLLTEMTNKVEFLHKVIADIKVDSTYTEEKISMLEEEVRLLWAASRKNNFDIHLLESKAHSTDRIIEAVTSKVEKMEDIVTEQWIQIRQLDQALKLTEIRVLEVQRRASHNRCAFLKFIKGKLGHHLPSKFVQLQLSSKESVPQSYFARTLHQLRSSMGAVKKKHHQMQALVKEIMETNKITAAFANQEVIFVVATVCALFPLWVAWVVVHLYYN